MQFKTESVNFNLAGRDLKIETGYLANQSTGSVTISLGDTVVLATAMMSDQTREGIDYFPLMVEYEERFYASGKIKGSRFIKREGRPSDNAILTSRLIDRPLRPLFPKNMKNEIQIICTVLSADLEVDPSTTAIIGASAAIAVAGIPFESPVASVRIGYITDSEGKEQLVINPTYEQCEKGRLNMVVAGTEDSITMVESGSNEVSEEIILQGLDLAHKHIKTLCALQKELIAKLNPKMREYIAKEKNEELKIAVTSKIDDELLNAVTGKTKAEVKTKIHTIEDTVLESFASEIEEEKYNEKEIKEIINDHIDTKMRENILKNEIRIDGRALDEIRPINCQVGLLPRTHGSAIFQRGETQALTITTLGSPGSAQIIDTMDEDSTKRYIHHYNFPPYSTGEVKMLRGTSRREIGHGYLAERSLEPMIPDKDVFPYTLRMVSEILSCNGSSSMASVCGSTLSLMDAGVPIKSPVAGIAMGLVTDGQNLYKILSDIQGLEDFSGDMDFKVTGTKNGINALQMDIKVKGLSIEIMREALLKARKGINFILAKMLETISEPKKEMSPYAPRITSLRIHPDQIREVIGKGGETIQKIIEETGVEIDIEDDGLVMITSSNQEGARKAEEIIKKITYRPKVGDVFEGKVTRQLDFGVFVQFAPGKEGLVHNSELDLRNKPKIGDTVKIKLTNIDDQGRYNLSQRAAMERPSVSN